LVLPLECGPPLKIYAILGASDGASLIGDSIYAFRALLVMKCLNIVFEAKAMPTPIVTLFSDRDSPYTFTEAALSMGTLWQLPRPAFSLS
jgi:hypothetical protein